jgi:membrane-bound lytic murein transglycosylase D
VQQPAGLRPGPAPLENHPFFLSVTIERDIDVALAARLAGLDEAEFLRSTRSSNKP